MVVPQSWPKLREGEQESLRRGRERHDSNPSVHRREFQPGSTPPERIVEPGGRALLLLPERQVVDERVRGGVPNPLGHAVKELEREGVDEREEEREKEGRELAGLPSLQLSTHLHCRAPKGWRHPHFYLLFCIP